MNGVRRNESDGVTRKPLSLFTKIKNTKDEHEKAKLGKFLEELSGKLPESLKLGAAVSKGDAFFDSLAQALNELKLQEKISAKKPFNVSFLRQCCQAYAAELEKVAWLDDALKSEGLQRRDYIAGVLLTQMDIKQESSAQKVFISGKLDIDGKIICKRFQTKIMLLELEVDIGDELDGDREVNFCISHRKMGKGKNIVYLLKYRNHCVPLLGSLREHIKQKTKVAWQEVYGCGVVGRDDEYGGGGDVRDGGWVGSETSGVKGGSVRDLSVREVGDVSGRVRKRKISDLTADNHSVVPKKSRLAPNLDFTLSSNGALEVENELVTRKPLLIFRQLKKARDPTEINQLKKALSTLKTHMPDGLKLAAAVVGADNFLDALAQSLNERDGVIACVLSVKSLRAICKDSWSKNESKLESKASIISKTFGVKIKILNLYADEQGAAYVACEKMGKGKMIVYIVNYQNHFVPLLSSIDDDIKLKIKVPSVHVYGTQQGNKRKSSNLEDEEIEQNLVKCARLDAEDTTRPIHAEATLKTTSKLKLVKSSAKASSTATKTYEAYTPILGRSIPYALLKLLYHLDLSALCLLRKSHYQTKDASLSLTFGNNDLEKFNDISINYKNKSILIQIEYVDNYYMDTGINYGKLFTKEKRSFSLNHYFECFVKYFHSKQGINLDNIKYLVVYTNAALELTADNKLKRGRFRDFCPFKFVKLKKCRILENFLKTNDAEGCGFYRFSDDEVTRAELLMRLRFLNCPRNELTAQFLDKLVFAVKQPEREDLNSFLRNEIQKNLENVDEAYYFGLQKSILQQLKASTKMQEPSFMYNFNLLLCFLSDMLLEDNSKGKLITSISQLCHDKHNDLILNYDNANKTIYLKILPPSLKSIGFAQLFPTKNVKTFSLSNCFQIYLENLKKYRNLQYFVVYTSADLNLNKEHELKKVRTKNFYAFKFCSLDVDTAAYEILKESACINAKGLYRFSKKDTKKLLSELQTKPISEEIACEFLKKLIFAVDQPKPEALEHIISKNESKVACNYMELQEIATRWSESHEFENLTQDVSQKLLQDIQANKSSQQHIQKNIEKEIRFARAMAGVRHYRCFLDYCLKGEGNKYMKFLEKAGIQLRNVSSMVGSARGKGFAAFESLCKLWFDQEGNKTHYLQTLEREKIDVTHITGILHRTRDSMNEAFIDLYYLLFDKEGNSTQYLKTLKREGIPFSSLSSVLQDSRANVAKAFKDLYDLWFDQQGNKTKYLKTLDANNISLKSVCCFLAKASSNAAKLFKEFYALFFEDDGSKTLCLKTLEKEHINLSTMSGILGGSGPNVSVTFKALYELWFDEAGNKTRYFSALEREGILMHTISNILHNSKTYAATAFKDLCDLWFDEHGQRTQYLKTLGRVGIDLLNLSSMLHGTGKYAASIYKELFELLFDEHGKKKRLLKTLEKEHINLGTLSNILCGAKRNVITCFQNFYNLLFDANGNKTHYLRNLEENDIKLNDMSSLLRKSGPGIIIAFKDLYDIWIDEEGNRRQCLLTLEMEGISLSSMSSILGGAGVNAATAFQQLFDTLFDATGEPTKYLKKFKNENINLANIFSILHGAGAKAAITFTNFYSIWFNEAGDKTHYLSTLEANGVQLPNVSSILNGAGSNATDAFKDLFNLWFDDKGNKSHYLEVLEREGIGLAHISSILHGTGRKASTAFKDLFEAFFDTQGQMKPHLSHFLKPERGKGFKLKNLSGVLSKTGSRVKNAFENFHDVCYEKNGKPTMLLNDFYDAEFKPSNLSAILFGIGVRAPAVLKNLHSVCFDEHGGSTAILNDFLQIGFKPGHLCSMLSGSTYQSLGKKFKKLHAFCFKAETSIYLKRFLSIEDGFTPSKLSKILHGAGANICAAIKEFHDVCFDESTQDESELLMDFRRVGLMPSDLTNILSMSGSNASVILIKLHKVCFGKRNYLKHFLDEVNIFTPKMLAAILHGIGIRVKKNFEALHGLCFDREGNKTKYLLKILSSRPTELVKILHERVKNF